VRNGDQIRLDVPERCLELLVDGDELDRRAREWQPPAHLNEEHRGYRGLYLSGLPVMGSLAPDNAALIRGVGLLHTWRSRADRQSRPLNEQPSAEFDQSGR